MHKIDAGPAQDYKATGLVSSRLGVQLSAEGWLYRLFRTAVFIFTDTQTSKPP